MSVAPRGQNVIRLGLVNGTTRYYGVQVARDGVSSRVRLTPQQAYGQLTTIGDTAQVSDQRTSSIIFGTSGGLGRDKYQETEGIVQYRWGEWDTRFAGSAVLPLATTALSTGSFNLAGPPVYMEYLGMTNAVVLGWVPRSNQSAGVQRFTGSAWVTVLDNLGGAIQFVTGFCRYRGAFYLSTTGSLFRSTDGITWTAVTALGTFSGICAHDNKFYGFRAGTAEMWWTLDPTAAISSWTGSNETLELRPGEGVNQLLEWEDDARHKCVYILTTQRLLRFDDEARTFSQVDDFSAEIYGTSGYLTLLPRMTVWKNDNNLYVNFYDLAAALNNPDTILQYTRQQKGFIAPNKLSGLPADKQVMISHLVGGLNYLFAFGLPPNGLGGIGQVLAWDGQGWHPLYTPTSVAEYVAGGGYGRGVLYVARAGSNVSLAYGDNRIRPEFRTDTYETGVTRTLRWARTTGGTDLLKKTELWATVPCRKKSGAFGLDTGCTLDLYRRLDGGSWALLASATSATTFPWQVDLATKANWYELEIRLDGATATAANTPILGEPQIHFDRTPQDVRDVYDFVIDPLTTLDSPTRGEHGRDAAAIVAELLALRGKMVTLELGAGATGGRAGKTSVTCGLFQMAMEADPQSGAVLMRCEVRDYSTPLSG